LTKGRSEYHAMAQTGSQDLGSAEGWGVVREVFEKLEFVAFFEERAKTFTGGPRNYNQVLERILLCEAQRSASAADIATFFAKQ